MTVRIKLGTANTWVDLTAAYALVEAGAVARQGALKAAIVRTVKNRDVASVAITVGVGATAPTTGVAVPAKQSAVVMAQPGTQIWARSATANTIIEVDCIGGPILGLPVAAT